MSQRFKKTVERKDSSITLETSESLGRESFDLMPLKKRQKQDKTIGKKEIFKRLEESSLRPLDHATNINGKIMSKLGFDFEDSESKKLQM